MFVSAFAVFLLGAAFSAVATACGDDDDGDSPAAAADPDPEADPEPDRTRETAPADETVKVTLAEWSVIPSRESVAAGVIEFLADNDGSLEHELVIRKAGDDEELEEAEDIKPNNVKSLKLRLAPGKYELSCLLNVDGEDHYKNGMKANFEVK